MYPYEDAPWTFLGLGVGFWVLMAILGVFALIAFFSSANIVEQKTAEIVERLGRYNRTLHPGLTFIIPFGIEKIAAVVELDVKQENVSVEVKTRTGEFITLPVTIQHRVIPGKEQEAHYEVEDPRALIISVVQNEVKVTATTLTLDKIYDSRDDIKTAVQTALTAELEQYGYMVVNVLIDNPNVPQALEDAFNDVTAAAQRKLAAERDAEALRATMVGAARAEAESLTIKADAIVSFRTTVAAGNADAIRTMTENTDVPHVRAMDYLTIVDTNDTVRDAAASGATVVVATGRPMDGLYAALPDARQPVASVTRRFRRSSKV